MDFDGMHLAIYNMKDVNNNGVRTKVKREQEGQYIKTK
jgi:hypothetical protein